MSRSFGNTYPSTIQSSSSSRMSVAPGTEWEDLRKQARQHENEIDAKLMSFSKLCSNYVAHDQNDTSSTTSTPSSFETMSIEIEKLLERLSDINKRMSDVVPSLLGPNSAATHTLQRHHEILQDYRREFERTKANIRSFQSREDFLINNNKNNSDVTTTTGLSSRRQDYYLREMGHLNSSHKLIDTNLEMASMIKKDLSDQRRYLLNITTKVNAIANRFPLVNNVLQKIKVKKRKDSLVLGFVIAICLIILLLYMFR
jgi:Golgi SNAP receptor complex protein 1